MSTFVAVILGLLIYGALMIGAIFYIWYKSWYTVWHKSDKNTKETK